MQPTHALFVVDNWDGEGNKYWIFAYQKDGQFHSSDTDKPILEYEGDQVLKTVKLP